MHGLIKLWGGIPEHVDYETFLSVGGSLSKTQFENRRLPGAGHLVKNQIVHCGRKLLLHSIFNDVDYSVGKVYLGDGANVFGSAGNIVQTVFPTHKYPETNQLGRNVIFSNSVTTIGNVEFLESELSIACAFLIKSDEHQIGGSSFHNDNSEKFVNNISLVLEGASLPECLPFPAGGPAMFSHATFPPMGMDPAAQHYIYGNWIFRAI
jgi:hypothetical protein